MNTFQLSNIGVTTWFHAGADNANTTPSTSSTAMNQNATKGFILTLFCQSKLSM